jgi:hypothetical protein
VGTVDTTRQETRSGETVILANAWWEVDIRLGADAGPCRVVDRRNGITVADQRYCYALDVLTGPLRHSCRGLTEVTHREQEEAGGGRSVVLEGRLDFGKSGPTDIFLRHRIALPADAPWLEEQITLLHHFGRHTHAMQGLRFGLRKMLYDRGAQNWSDGLGRFRLTPVPHRRRFGHRVDRRTTDYSAADLFPLSWDRKNNLPDHGSEGWIWGDGTRGILIAKYNPTEIEFSIFDGELLLQGESAGGLSVMDAVSSHVPIPVHVCARFAGVGLYRDDPEVAESLAPEAEITFGLTRLVAFQGDWQEGYGAYREHLRALGHALQPGFNPPLHWNELYNLGWRLGDNAPLQTRPQVEAEAAIAADIGAESLYFDPTWDIAEGSTIWDTARLGDLAEFVQMLRDRYNLQLSLHLMMHTTKLNEDPAIYLRDSDGNRVPFHLPDDLYPNARVCCASTRWKELKKQRLLALAEAGATFFMFDFLNYNKQSERIGVRQKACVDPSHGHVVPLTRQAHAEGVLEVIQAVKAAYPQVLIEAHDRVNGGMQDYHPLYYQHGLPNSFDSNWGFEYMWDPYYDLLSGKALSLYEYNLAYDIPLYLHIHEGRDSTTMLAFWWYASTCRHLGIGGVSDQQSPLYAALKQAVSRYRHLKPFFTQGEFVGLDLFSHLHVLPDRGAAVGVFFNLSSEPETRTVTFDTARLGFSPNKNIQGASLAPGTDGMVTLTVEVAPLSPVLVELFGEGTGGDLGR